MLIDDKIVASAQFYKTAKRRRKKKKKKKRKQYLLSVERMNEWIFDTIVQPQERNRTDEKRRVESNQSINDHEMKKENYNNDPPPTTDIQSNDDDDDDD